VNVSAAVKGTELVEDSLGVPEVGTRLPLKVNRFVMFANEWVTLRGAAG